MSVITDQQLLQILNILEAFNDECFSHFTDSDKRKKIKKKIDALRKDIKLSAELRNK